MVDYPLHELFNDIRVPLARLVDDVIDHRVADMLEAGRDLYRFWRAALSRQGAELPMEDEHFVFLCGLDSELDRFPLGRERALWAKDALAEVDPVLAEMRGDWGPDIVAAARVLRERLARGWLTEWMELNQ